MKKVLIGMICDGKAGGIDKYLLNFYDTVKSEDICVDFLTNNKDPELEKRLNETGARLYEIPSLMHPVRQYNEVKKLIQHNGYDIVYMNISTALTFPILKAAYDCKVKKIIAHSHSSGYDSENAVKRSAFTWLHFLCKGFVCKYANSFLCCSDKAAEWMFDRAIIRRKKFQVVLNAVDTSKFTFDNEKRQFFRKKLGLENKFVIGNVGNMCYPKNQLFLIDVFYELLKKTPDAHLVIIGDGVLLPQIQTKIGKYHLEENVSLLGRVDVSEGYMNAFDVFALPSRFEGLGIVFIEAQYTRVPCVASDRVPSLAKISNMISFVPLNVQKWVNQLLFYKNIDKADFLFEDEDGFVLSKQKEELCSVLDVEEGVDV